MCSWTNVDFTTVIQDLEMVSESFRARVRMCRISQVIMAILAEGGGAEEDTSSRTGICKSEGFTAGISSM